MVLLIFGTRPLFIIGHHVMSIDKIYLFCMKKNPLFCNLGSKKNIGSSFIIPSYIGSAPVGSVYNIIERVQYVCRKI